MLELLFYKARILKKPQGQGSPRPTGLRLRPIGLGV